MIDFHSHILPMMDDGSRSVEETAALLDQSVAQGVTHILATPHFYPDRENIDSFLVRRSSAEPGLRAALDGKPISVCLGAEVAYYFGMSRRTELRTLCVTGTDLMLVEMPFTPWTDAVMDDILLLRSELGVNPVLAHIERYFPAHNFPMIVRLREQGIMMQCNASFFTDFWTSRRACRLLSEGLIDFIGSDCHRKDIRPQQLGSARTAIEKRIGPEAFAAFMSDCREKLEGARWADCVHT